MSVNIKGPRVSKDGKKSYYLRRGFARDPETGKQDVAAITWHPPAGLKPAEELRQLNLFAAQWEETEIQKRKNAPRNSGYTADSAFIDYARHIIQLKLESNAIKKSTVSGYNYLLSQIEKEFGRTSIEDVTPDMIDRFVSKLRRQGVVKRWAVAKPQLCEYAKNNRLGETAAESLRINPRGCSRSAIARVANMAQSTVSVAMAGEAVEVETAQKISSVMGYNAADLFELHTERRDYAEKTLREYVNVMSSILSVTKRRGITSSNAAEAAIHPSATITNPRSALSEGQIKKVISAIMEEAKSNSGLAAAAIVGMWTGFRRGDLMGLTHDSFDFEHMTITASISLLYKDGTVYIDTPKNKTAHTAPMGDELAEFIKGYMQYKKRKHIVPRGEFAEYGFLFLNGRTGRPLHPTSLTGWVSDLGKSVGIKNLNLYTMRHTVATQLHAAGVPLKAIADQLGDKMITTIDRHYINSVPQFKNQVKQALTAIFGTTAKAKNTVNKRRILTKLTAQCIDTDTMNRKRYSARKIRDLASEYSGPTKHALMQLADIIDNYDKDPNANYYQQISDIIASYDAEPIDKMGLDALDKALGKKRTRYSGHKHTK